MNAMTAIAVETLGAGGSTATLTADRDLLVQASGGQDAVIQVSDDGALFTSASVGAGGGNIYRVPKGRRFRINNRSGGNLTVGGAFWPAGVTGF